MKKKKYNFLFISSTTMLKFGLLVALPLALGFMPTQSGYGTGSGSNGANSGINMANMNMGSSGTNARMSPNASNMGPQQQNHPSGSRNMIPGREFRDNLPYREFWLLSTFAF